jgi:ketosteroid isomerase-like protein
MYHFFVRRRLRLILGKLNDGDFAFITRQFHRDAAHSFSGKHALSGTRTTPGRIAEWYRRLAAVFPGIRFDVKMLFVAGPPWNTQAAIQWVDEVRDREGRPLPNEGVFLIRLRWGKATELRVYCDTALIETNLGILASQGVEEARAAPIVG